MRLFLLVGGAAVFAWYRRLRTEAELPRYAPVAALLVAVNLTQLAAREWLYIHEVAAGVLLALALALYRPARPWLAMAVVATALAIRETIVPAARSEEHTSELPSLMRISYAGFCLKQKTTR